MILQNYLTQDYVDYPFEINNNTVREYRIAHETPFTERFGEWMVAILTNNDMVYIPTGSNRCRDVYIVTWEYINGIVRKPYGVYKVARQFVDWL